MRHPKPDIVESGVATEARRLAEELGLTGTHVFFNEGWVAYHERQNYLLESDVGVSLHLDHLETQYSFRTRMLDYLWAGLPIVATAGDGFAQIIATEGIGTVVPPGDVDAVAGALVALLADRHARETCRARAVAVASRFRWSAVLEPVVSFCAAPHHAPDAPDWPGTGAPSPSGRTRGTTPAAGPARAWVGWRGCTGKAGCEPWPAGSADASARCSRVGKGSDPPCR